MGIHITSPVGAIAPVVLLPGDPLRAKFIAETFLENSKCYNEVRGMYGFTGTYKGVPISVQGTGMGQPSLSIYVHELFEEYGVQVAMRVGTCGGMQKNIQLKDVILANAACSDSSLLTQRFGCMHFAPAADFSLLEAAHLEAKKLNIRHHVGECVSNDLFYEENETWKKWAAFGVLGVEMETAELYTLAAQFGRKALGILSVSDLMYAPEQMIKSEDRRIAFTDMMKIALETAVTVSK